MKEFNSSGELIIQDGNITQPGSPVNKSYVDNLVSLDAYKGTGSPEGKITAPVGSIYTDSAATNGAIRWVKSSGTGSTGWSVEHGDTGWRELTPINGWTGSLYVRRVNGTVFYRGVLNAAAATNGNAWDIPIGFRIGNILSSQGQGYDYGRAIVSSEGNSPEVRNMNFYFSRFNILGYSPAHSYGISVSYSTTNGWPESLPGVPA